MKGENEYNAALSRQFRKLLPKVFAIKVSDKYKTGLSDFLIWGEGALSCGLESKFIQDWPGDNQRLLKHVFSGPQINFLTHLRRTGNLAYGLVAVKATREAFLIPVEQIPAGGNWKTKEFRQAQFLCVGYCNAQDIIEHIFRSDRRFEA